MGQPFDTIKTRIQSTSISSKVSTVHAFSSLFQKEGIRGFYRGMFPLAYGSVFFRFVHFCSVFQCLYILHLSVFLFFFLLDCVFSLVMALFIWGTFFFVFYVVSFFICKSYIY